MSKLSDQLWMNGILRWQLTLAVFGAFSVSACGAPASARGAASAAAPSVDESVKNAGHPRPVQGAARDAHRVPPPAQSPCIDEHLGAAHFDCTAGVIVGEPRDVWVPQRAELSFAGRRLLRDIGQLLQRRKDLLLLRLEVFAGGTAPADPAQRREAALRAQRRADVLLEVLWQKEHVSAERLDAVGYGYELGPVQRQSLRGTAGRWPVVFRVVQRSR